MARKVRAMRMMENCEFKPITVESPVHGFSVGNRIELPCPKCSGTRRVWRGWAWSLIQWLGRREWVRLHWWLCRKKRLWTTKPCPLCNDAPNDRQFVVSDVSEHTFTMQG